MKHRFMQLALIALMALLLAACGDTKDKAAPTSTNTPQTEAKGSEKPAEASQGMRDITYLGNTYQVPEKVDNIVVAGSVESMEDALVLGVQLTGANTVGGEMQSLFAEITKNATPIGDKQHPNIETILGLDPDVILGSTKFKPEAKEKLSKAGTMIPVSYKAIDWEANLMLLAELTGKQEEAKQLIQKYKDDVAATKTKLGDKVKEKKVVALRIRRQELCIYPTTVFFNPSLYEELGFTAPEEVKAAKVQEIVSLEKFSQMNPDVIFLQFAAEENKKNVKALEELQNNPIWKNLDAVKNNQVFINVVDPAAQGGTLWSKQEFLKAVVEKMAP